MRVRITKDPILAAFRRNMGPSGNGFSDKYLKRMAGWFCFRDGWKAHEEYLKPIKAEPLTKRTISA